MGILADEPGKETLLKAFHGKVVKEIYEGKLVELPVVSEVSKEEVEKQFRRVKREVVELVENEHRRMLGDPAMGGYYVESIK